MQTLLGVSVVIPAYNRAHCIHYAIQSVLDQTCQPHELLIVDDGSTDDLQSVLDNYDAPYIRLIKHQENQGASQARNTGIEKAVSEYIAFLDSDDTWKKDKLETQLAFMVKHNLEASCTNFSLYRNDKLEQETTYRPYNTNRLTEKHLAWGCFISPGTTFICKKDLLSALGGYDLNFPRFEDWDLLFRLSQKIDLGWLDKSLSNIYVEKHAAEHAERQGLRCMYEKHVNKKTPKTIRRIIASSIYFNQASIYFMHKKYVLFLLFMMASFLKKPFGNFPIKAIFIPKIFSRK